jgi:hypothetical protein
MKNDWIIDILREIRSFSEKNGFLELAEHLDDVIFVAAREIAASREPDFAGTIAVREGTLPDPVIGS